MRGAFQRLMESYMFLVMNMSRRELSVVSSAGERNVNFHSHAVLCCVVLTVKTLNIALVA